MPERSDPLPPVRRRAVVGGLLGFGTAVCGALAPTAASAIGGKVSQAQARYQGAPRGGNRCDRCLQFQPPSACKIVEGVVSPTGSCNFFAPKPT